MAWVNTGFTLNIRSIDNGGNETTKSFDMVAADHATALVDALIIVGFYEAVTNSGTVSYSLNERFYNDSLTIPGGAESQVEAKALIVLRDETNPLKKHSVRIASPDPTVFLAASGDGANIIDVNDAAITAFANMFSAAGSNKAYISDGEQALAAASGGLLYGRRVTHRSGRG